VSKGINCEKILSVAEAMTVNDEFTLSPLIPPRNVRKQRVITSVITHPMSKPLLLCHLSLNPSQNPIQPRISMNWLRFTRES
jgi:hypothetical protein